MVYVTGLTIPSPAKGEKVFSLLGAGYWLAARLHHFVNLIKGFMPLVLPLAWALGTMFAVPKNRSLGFCPAGQAQWFE